MKVTTLCGITLILTCKVFADQLGEPRCERPEEVYGNAQLKSDLGALEKFTNGFEVNYRCKPGFVTSSSLKRTCSNGTWTSIECTQRCRLEQCYRKCMYIGGYPPRGLVEHGVRVTKVCREEFEFEPKDLRHHANYTSTCDEGQISFPECIQRRCKIPIGEKGGDIKTYSPGDLVHCGLTVKKSCDSTQELYNSDRMSYLDSETFENTCKLGQWSKPDFPVCRNTAIYEIEVTVGMGKWDGSWNTLNVSFINEKGQTTPRFPIQTSLFRGQTYNAKIGTHYIGEIQRLHFTLHGRIQDNLGLQYINLKVTRGGQVEEYAIHGERNIVDQDNFNVDPGCPLPSTNGKLLRPKKRYIMGDKIQPNDVQCEPGYILSSTVTCMHNVKWSATCEKEAEDTTYTLTFSRTHVTRQKITVVLHGTGGSTKELALNQQGVFATSTFSRTWTLPSVGEINSIDVTVEVDFRSFAINYIQLIDQNRNLYYLSFHNGIFRGKNTLQVYDQFRPGCRGTTFLPEQNGYLKNNKLAKYHRISLWQNCEDLCRKDGSCTAFMVYKRLFKHCYLVSGYSLGQFKFAPNNNEFKIHFRACS